MSDRLALMADSRVPGDARLIGLYLLELGEGWHEVAHNDFRALVGGGVSDDTLRRHLRSLEASGWVERREGGRGHSPSYRMIDRHDCGANAPFRDALLSWVLEKTGNAAGLSTDRSAPIPVYPPIDPHPIGSKPPGSSSSGGGSNPPVVPPTNLGRVSKSAAELIAANSQKLAGCRGALRDYLAARVPPDRQRGYVGSLLGWLDGLDENVWLQADGSKLAPDRRTATLATALNELATADETTRKWPPGDVTNLRNKIDAILKPKRPRTHERDAAKPSRSATPGPNERYWGRTDGPGGGAAA